MNFIGISTATALNPHSNKSNNIPTYLEWHRPTGDGHRRNPITNGSKWWRWWQLLFHKCLAIPSISEQLNANRNHATLFLGWSHPVRLPILWENHLCHRIDWVLRIQAVVETKSENRKRNTHEKRKRGRGRRQGGGAGIRNGIRAKRKSQTEIEIIDRYFDVPRNTLKDTIWGINHKQMLRFGRRTQASRQSFDDTSSSHHRHMDMDHIESHT